MAEKSIEALDSNTLHLVFGRTLKELAKRGKIEGVDGEIAVEERDGKTLLSFAEVQEPVAMVVNGQAGFFLVPAYEVDGDSGGKTAAEVIKEAIGATGITGFEEAQIRATVTTGGVTSAETITILRKVSA